MNPFGAMRGQAIALGAVGAASCLTALWPFQLGLAVLLVAVWGLLNRSYAQALGDLPRRTTRVDGDIEVVRQVALIFALWALAKAISVLGIQIADSQQVATALILAVAFFEAMYLSSTVDWYYVRPRRDGVVMEPPCRTSMQPVWDVVTRRWYRHRCVTTFVCYIAASAGVGFIALAIMGRGGSPTGLEVGAAFLASATFAGAIMARFYGSLSEVGAVFTSCSISPPDHAIGQRLLRNDESGGVFIRDVAIECVACVPLAVDQAPSGDGLLRSRVSEVQGNHELRRTKFDGCRFGCSKVNADCEWIYPIERPACHRRRWVVRRDVDLETGRRVAGYEDPELLIDA